MNGTGGHRHALPAASGRRTLRVPNEHTNARQIQKTVVHLEVIATSSPSSVDDERSATLPIQMQLPRNSYPHLTIELCDMYPRTGELNIPPHNQSFARGRPTPRRVAHCGGGILEVLARASN